MGAPHPARKAKYLAALDSFPSPSTTSPAHTIPSPHQCRQNAHVPPATPRKSSPRFPPTRAKKKTSQRRHRNPARSLRNAESIPAGMKILPPRPPQTTRTMRKLPTTIKRQTSLPQHLRGQSVAALKRSLSFRTRRTMLRRTTMVCHSQQLPDIEC